MKEDTIQESWKKEITPPTQIRAALTYTDQIGSFVETSPHSDYPDDIRVVTAQGESEVVVVRFVRYDNLNGALYEVGMDFNSVDTHLFDKLYLHKSTEAKQRKDLLDTLMKLWENPFQHIFLDRWTLAYNIEENRLVLSLPVQVVNLRSAMWSVLRGYAWFDDFRKALAWGRTEIP